MLRSVVELLAPSRCLACGARGAFPWCPSCARVTASLRMVDGCGRCGAGTGTGHGCWPSRTPVSATVVAFDYRGPVAKAIVAAKARGAWAAWSDLGQELASVVRGRLAPPLPQAVTWVPAARDRIRARGLDHAERLAAPVAAALGLPLEGLLAAAGRRPDQTDLPLDARRHLDPGAFRAARPSPERVLLVDDVLTTGATVSVAAAALTRAGARSITVAVLARAGAHPLGAGGGVHGGHMPLARTGWTKQQEGAAERPRRAKLPEPERAYLTDSEEPRG